MRYYFFPFSIFTLLFLLCAAPADAQQNEQNIEVNSIRVEIDGTSEPGDVMRQMTTLETPWGLWIYLNENIYRKIGAPRAYYNQFLFAQDVAAIGDYFAERGFFNAVIDTVLTFSEDGTRVNIDIAIKENKRSMIDSFTVVGIEAVDSSVVQQIRKDALVKVGDPFVRRKVVDEQTRILKILQNSGYPKAFLDSVDQARYASTNNISILLKFNPGARYRFGQIQFDHDDDVIDSTVLIRQLDFEPGDYYSEEKRIISEQNLNRLGVFQFASVRQRPPSGNRDNDSIPLLITFRMLELQEITPEFLVLNENNSLFSTGLGLGYKHRNLFGGAQNFTISSRARANQIEKLNFQGAVSNGLSEQTLFGKADIQSQLVFPYFFSNKTSASITLTGEAEKQNDYNLNTLRAKVSFSTKLATYTIGVTDFNIERVDPFYKSEKNTGIPPDDSTKQFNFIESYTLQRDKTNNFFSPTEGFLHSISFEEAGLVSRTAGGFGLPYSEYVKISLLVKHYFSGVVNKEHVFAFKIKGGAAKLYNQGNNPTPVPLPRRFLVGGSNSVRAWKDKQLSAFGDLIQGGNIAFEGSLEYRNQLFPNGGNINVLELPRFWSVLFLDGGNTWLNPTDVTLKQVALAVGFGLRYETFVGPFRFDIAWRLYDPQKPQGQQWLTEQQFFRNSFSLVHFGIGHAF